MNFGNDRVLVPGISAQTGSPCNANRNGQGFSRGERATMDLGNPLLVGGLYTVGSFAIVVGTLFVGWMLVWRCLLVKMPFVREIFDLPKLEKKRA